MKYVIIMVLAILPTVFIWKYINDLDKHKEPGKVLSKLFLGGFLAIIITVVLSIALSLIFTDFFEYVPTFSITGFLYCVLGIGLVEELSKFLMMYAFGWHEKNLDETYDIILYAMIVALGFATAENILYSLDGGIETSIYRIFTAVPGHVINASFMGYFLYRYRLNGNKVNFLFAIIVPSLTHGIYDFLALACGNLIVFIVFVVIEFIIAKRLVSKIARESKFLTLNSVYCKRCGKLINTRFCPNCGKERE